MKKEYAGSYRFWLQSPPGLDAVLLKECEEKSQKMFSPQFQGASWDFFEGFACSSPVRLSVIWEWLMTLGGGSTAWMELTSFSCQTFSQLENALQKIPWNSWNDGEWEVKVDSISHPLYHEKKIKEIVLKILPQTKSENKEKVFVFLHKKKCYVLLQLTKRPFYHKQYKSQNQGVAPLREDIAYLCAYESFHKHLLKDSWGFLVPFAGTGTLAFEGLNVLNEMQSYFWESPKDFGFWERGVSSSSQRFLLQKRREKESLKKITVAFIDYHQPLLKVLEENVKSYQEKVNSTFESSIYLEKIEDVWQNQAFLKWYQNQEHIFMPMNPPYGLRLEKSEKNLLSLFSFLGKKCAQIAREKNLKGYILCPSESLWRTFLTSLGKDVFFETKHFMQGGKDIRLVLFSSQNEKENKDLNL